MKLRRLIGAGVGSLLAAVGCDGPLTNVGDLTGAGGGSPSSTTSAGGGSPSSTTSEGSGGAAPVVKAKRVDVLVALDNSGSMGAKQKILQGAVKEYLESLANPPCSGGDGTDEVPAAADGSCPNGMARVHPPIEDIHFGVISSSLGGHGSDSCESASENDHGRLLDRTSPDDSTKVPTQGGLGLVAYGPGNQDLAAFTGSAKALMGGVGSVGCGFEAQLESVYRFLVEPEPYASITVNNGQADLNGVDTKLLEQRAAFLRPDSLLVVIALSDENDASVRDGSQFYWATQRYEPGTSKSYRLPKARASCADDPNSSCCRSCAEFPGQGCDATLDKCDVNNDGKTDPLAPEDDNMNLRAFDQKRRFGIDFLQPIDRSVRAFTSSTILDRKGSIVPNMLFAERTPEMVVFASVLGVPWQDLVRSQKDAKGELKDTAELDVKQGGVSTWEVILGDPANYVKALDPHMVESVEPRTGTNPITGTSTAAPGSPPESDPITGAERLIPGANDLQFACTFELPIPIDCSKSGDAVCDCKDAVNADKNPLCSPSKPTLQLRDKAYPGLRQLAVMKALGSTGTVVSSVCPIQLMDASLGSYGYRPMVRALQRRTTPLF